MNLYKIRYKSFGTILKMKISIILLLIFSFSSLKAQDNNSILLDSLLKVAESAPENEKFDKFSSLCWKMRNYDPEQALEFGKRALEYARKFENNEQIIKALSYIGVCYRNLGNYDDAFEVYNQGLDMSLKYGVKDQAAYSYINIGNLYLYHDKYHEADSNLLKALVIAREIKDSSILGYANLNLGRVNLGLNRNQTAILYLKEALKIRQEQHDEWDKIVTVKKYIGDANYADSIYDEALKYYMAALPREDERLKDNDLLSDIYGKISRIYLINKEYDKALSFGKKCLETSKLRGIDFRIKNASQNLGDIYYKKGELDSAISMYSVVMNYADTFFNNYKSFGIANYEIKFKQLKKEADLAVLKQEKETRRWINISLGTFLVIFLAAIIILIKTNRNKIRTNKLLQNQNDEIEARNVQISQQRDALQKQQKEITDSIVYAKRIQFSIIPDKEILKDYFNDGFVFHLPRDVVSGDFWWSFHDNDYFILMCADCTGHGVPGAFMSMLGVSALNEIVVRDRKRNAADIMNSLRELVKKTVNQNLNEGKKLQDGMDGALIVVNKKTNILEYSGANIPFICYRKGEEIVIKSTHNPIGVYVVEIPFVSHEFPLEKGDRIYLSSDGYYSQFGGPRDTLLKSSGYKRILRSFQDFDMDHQRQIIEDNFFAWKGKKGQTDDILVIGMEV